MFDTFNCRSLASFYFLYSIVLSMSSYGFCESLRCVSTITVDSPLSLHLLRHTQQHAIVTVKVFTFPFPIVWFVWLCTLLYRHQPVLLSCCCRYSHCFYSSLLSFFCSVSFLFYQRCSLKCSFHNFSPTVYTFLFLHSLLCSKILRFVVHLPVYLIDTVNCDLFANKK